jgi:hypothetical protein
MYELLGADELTAIATRANQATPGPWIATPGRWHLPRVRLDNGSLSEGMVPALVRWTHTSEDSGQVTSFVARSEDPHCNCDADADFIAHARDDIPRLLTLLGHREAELVELRSLVQRFEAWADDTTLPTSFREPGRTAQELLAGV